MTDAVIRVRGIGKLYEIGERRHGYKTLRESLASLFARTRAKASANAGANGHHPKTFWALKGVSFDVQRGEIVGIIGRNGAGKSTLLKILSRITDPTEGEIEIEGRVGSLLEVGTGFHPELTGRENIFLNGAILGMKRAEIAARFDEIVAFAGTEKFLDTPVKYYSSGMYVRLAFGVAAHLEPEILIVDEVLSVGDAEFQKKCLGKIGDVARSGRTVLFVSHNLIAVSSLCARSVLLEGGRVLVDGPATDVLSIYEAKFSPTVSKDSNLSEATRTGTGRARFTSMTVQPVDSDGSPLDAVCTGGDLKVDIAISAIERISDSNVSLIIFDQNGYRLANINTWRKGRLLDFAAGDDVRVTFRIRDLLLRPGSYSLGLWIGREGFEVIDYIEQAAAIDIAPNPGDNKSPVQFTGSYLLRYEQSISTRTAPDALRAGVTAR